MDNQAATGSESPQRDTPSPSVPSNVSTWGDITYGFLDPKLEGLIRAALEFFSGSPNPSQFKPDQGVMSALRQCIELETDPPRRQRMTNLLNDLKTYFFTPSYENAITNDGQLLLSVSADGLAASLTVTPPRGGSAGIPTINRVRNAFERAQILHGVDLDVINRSLEIIREQVNDVVWKAVFARGEAPTPGHSRHIAYDVKVIDKSILRKDNAALASHFEPFWDPVTDGMVIGHIAPSREGIPGRNVHGDALQPERPQPVDFDLGDVIHLSRGILTAQSSGYVIVDGTSVDIVPLYIVENPEPSSLNDFAFPGAILIRGHLQGPGSVECEDLYVLGNCEMMNVNARGDVFVAGGIVGHNQSTIDADGVIYTSFVSESRISALGEVVVANAIINSHVTSNKHVLVTSDKGLIAGGTVQALREVVVRTIGSEFGMLTETIVGKDFLTTSRLGQIIERIKEHEAGLRRIQELKAQLSKARVRVEDLPADRQELYLGVLRKESASQAELRSLARRRSRLSTQLREFLSASVRVTDSIFPPARVQIVNEIKEINNKLNAVTLKYDADVKGIVTTFSGHRSEEPS